MNIDMPKLNIFGLGFFI